MSLLEDRYRFVLRVLPASYRQVWEEEMVATFLDSVPGTEDPQDVELARPSWPEVASVLALAVRLRLGMLRLRLDGEGARRRRVAWGEVLRLVAPIGLLANALVATMLVGQILWLAGRLPWPPAPGEEWLAEWAHSWPSTVRETLWTASGLVWAAAYLTLVVGRRRLAVGFALAGLVTLGPQMVAAVGSTVNLPTARALPALIGEWSWLLLFGVLPVVALVAFHRDSPPLPRRPWLVAFAVGVVLVHVAGVVLLLRPPYGGWLDWPGLYCVGVVTAAVVHLTGRTRAPSWSLTLALLTLAALWIRLVSLADYLLNWSAYTRFQDAAAVTVAGVVEAVAVLTVAVPLAVLAGRARGPLTPAAAGSTGSTTTR